jgi:signal transduction histidine kinase
MRILLVDDHATVRRTLRDLIEIADEHEVIGEASNGREAITKAVELEPDLVLMDVNMPVMDGLEATQEIMKHAPDVKILALTALGDMAHVTAMVRAGASGYLLKGGSSEDLLDSLRAIDRGEGPVDKEVTVDVIRGLADLETQLHQAQKMESVGQLVSGIAHDFNNLLSVIGNYAQFISDDLAVDDPKKTDLGEVLQATERASGLVRQLLSFSRKENPTPQLIELSSTLRSAEKMWGRALGEDIEFRTALDPELDRVRMDPTQLEQILLNLVVNARDAMPKGGTLTIGAHNLVGIPPGAPPALGWGRYVCLTVSDSGTGIPPDVVARIFDPFFTTKPRESGTGLGLATVHGIVKQVFGHIDVQTEPGRGTTFRIYLASAEEREAEQEIDEAPTSRMVTGIRVLVVEDEEAVRRLVVRILERAGCNVRSAASGPEAIQLLGRLGEVDLIVTDVVMPGMSGVELANQAARTRPSTKVLFMSGYSDRVLARHDLGTDLSYVAKPFTAVELLEAISTAVERRDLTRTRTTDRGRSSPSNPRNQRRRRSDSRGDRTP